MNIGFILPRSPIIKLYAPIIEYFLLKRIEVTIFCDYRQAPKELGYKSYTYPYKECVPIFKNTPDTISYSNIPELCDMIMKRKIRALFLVNFWEISKEVKNQLSKDNYQTVFIQLQYFLELFLTAKDLSYFDVIYTYSESWEHWWKDYIDVKKIRNISLKEIEEKCINIGFPEFDQCKTFDSILIRKKYQIPDKKKVILLFPFPWRLQFSPWTHIVYKPQPRFIKFIRLFLHRSMSLWQDVRQDINDFRLTQAIKAFARKNDAMFIVKGRQKNRIPGYLRKMADRVYFDESYYPFITLELLYIADLSISFYSAAIMESVITRTPTINLAPKNEGYWPGYDDRHNMPAFSPKPGSFYNYEGVVFYEAVDRFIASFREKTFNDYQLDGDRAGEFLKKFMGPDDHQACERLYADLSKRLLEFV